MSKLQQFYQDPEGNWLPRAPVGDPDEDIKRILAKGAEPFWMQDVRLAQRLIDDQRRPIEVGARPSSEDQAASES